MVGLRRGVFSKRFFFILLPAEDHRQHLAGETAANLTSDGLEIVSLCWHPARKRGCPGLGQTEKNLFLILLNYTLAEGEAD